MRPATGRVEGRRTVDVGYLIPRVQAVALGIAVGVVSGLALFLLTVFHLVAAPQAIPIGLLSQYFYGYDATWPGAFAGLAWGGAAGFAAGWLAGILHNVSIDLWLLVVQTRADLTRRRNLLDGMRPKRHER
jgi:hypothetical protein